MSTAAPELRARHGWVGWLGVALAVAAAALSFQQAGDSWFNQRGDVGIEGSLATGTALTGGIARTVPTAVLAAQLLVLVFGAQGRRLVGLFTILAGLVMVWCGVFTDAPGVGDAPISGGAVRAASRTSAAWTYAALGATVLLGGLLLALRPGGAGRGHRVARGDDAWTILDRGEDPTAS